MSKSKQDYSIVKVSFVLWLVFLALRFDCLAESPQEVKTNEPSLESLEIKVPHTESARGLARDVLIQANNFYYRLMRDDIKGFNAVFSVERNGQIAGKIKVGWNVGTKQVSASFQGTIDDAEREKARQFAQTMIGPLCGYLIKPESETGYPLYAARFGGEYVFDVSGAGKLANVASDVLFLSSDFLQTRDFGKLKNGLEIDVIRKGVRSKKGSGFLRSMTLALRKPGSPEQKLECTWSYASQDGFMFVKEFKVTESEGDRTTSWKLTLEKVGADKTGKNMTHRTKATTKQALPRIKKYVTQQANFVIYVPEGWTVSEGAAGGFRTLTATDPSGIYQAAMFSGSSPRDGNIEGITNLFVQAIRSRFPDLTIGGAKITPNGQKIVFDGVYTDGQKRKKEFRSWISLQDENFVYTSMEAPMGKLADARQQLLTILSNIRVIKGAYQSGGAVKVSWGRYRMRDGSASFLVPQDWQVQEFGTGAFAAKDPGGLLSFVVAGAEVLSPRLGVNVPNVPMSDYLSPHQALKFLAQRQGLLHDMRFEEVIPRRDLTQQISQAYTAGPVTVEEFIYTFTSQGRRCKGYSFGVTFGSRLGVNWRLWHMSVGAPVSQFDPFVANFVTMLQSYKISDQFAMDYIARGTARLRQLQRQTSEMVARNAQEIRQMMQSAYDERQRSQAYIDYQRTNYIRGEQDWISGMEGGTVYHSDSWGTQNTATGEYWKGQPYNYVNFGGENPRYNEQMTPINDRATYERAFGVPH